MEPVSGKIVIAVLDGELTVKKLVKTEESCRLVAENPNYPDILIKKGMELEIWGVVTSAIHKL